MRKTWIQKKNNLRRSMKVKNKPPKSNSPRSPPKKRNKRSRPSKIKQKTRKKIKRSLKNKKKRKKKSNSRKRKKGKALSKKIMLEQKQSPKNLYYKKLKWLMPPHKNMISMISRIKHQMILGLFLLNLQTK